MSNYYRGCDKAPPPDSASFTAWNESHKKSCNKNFDGTSNAMEVEAAAVIFARSVEQRKLIYGTMLCDGDSKALDNVNRLGIYDLSARQFDLTGAKIKKITNTYAKNLRDNAHVEQMKLGVLGGFFHMMSTDKTPNNRLCPRVQLLGVNKTVHLPTKKFLENTPQPSPLILVKLFFLS